MRHEKIALMLAFTAAGLCQGPGVIDTLVDGENCRGWHVSTRPHNRKVVYHAPSKSWFVFHGTGAWADKTGNRDSSREVVAWRRSEDGVRFTPLAEATSGNGHTSSVDVVLAGDRIYLTAARFSYWRTKAGIPWMVNGKPFFHPDNRNLNGANFYCAFEVFPFEIAGGRLVAGEPAAALPGDAHMGNEGPHYGSLTRDTSGYFWAAARAMAGLDGRFVTWVARTTRPGDITAWQPHTVMFKSNGPGTHAPQIIALDQGRVALILFVKNELKTSVYLFDPRSHAWGSPHVLSGGYESKRASAVFDPGSRRLHVVYTDDAGDARHRVWAAPYTPESFSPPLDRPGTMVAPKAGANPGDDDLSLSANLSQNPAPLALVHRGPDLHLHLRYYDGRKWSAKDVQAGQQDPALMSDEASAVADFSRGLGFLYWCQWKDPLVRKQKDEIGQLRFGLVKDVAALFDR